MSIDYGNPPRDFIEEYRADEPTAAMCETCGYALVSVNGADECPLCDRIPSNNKPAALYEAGTAHPVFSGGSWHHGQAADVAECPFDGCVVHEVEETTERIEPETMAQAVAR